MQLMRYRPWGDLGIFRNEIDRLFGDFFGAEETPRLAGRQWTPPLDIAETEKSVVVKAEVPGMSPDDLKISIIDDVLTIRGERKAEKEEKGKDFHRVERTYGSFCRTVRIPTDVDEEKVNATYEKGVLEIDLTKKEKASQREIKVKVK